MDIREIKLADLQPSQFYISEQKLARVEAWLDPNDLSGFEPVPVRKLDGALVMTDGHTRAAAAVRAGLERVPLAWEQDELDWEMYRRCVKACVQKGVLSPLDLAERIVSPEEYREKWDRWCDLMQEEVRRERAERTRNREET